MALHDRRVSIRCATRSSSTLVPIQMFGAHGPFHLAARSGRLVRTWNVTSGSSFMTAKTCSMKSSETSGWKRSDMEFTKTRVPGLNFRGLSSRFGCSMTFSLAFDAVQGFFDQPNRRLSRSA